MAEGDFHPAEDIVDPETAEMIDENVAATPHADLSYDAMSSADRDSTLTRPASSGLITRPTIRR